MKFQATALCFATMILSVQAQFIRGNRFQCAAVNNNDGKYEPSGFVTSRWTQDTCNGMGIIDPGSKLLGNRKCCSTTDDFGKFQSKCLAQKLPDGFGNNIIRRPQPC
ncbi:uncharacterized protein CTRU02_204823 [Colletotrichum truncatum]|uniref:Uncharacterized protein n=1 Tax=Colletotrichum truncatum TaxID=5467 RepID=A0ACC3ZDG4_COLTU|nr:uncharacterized protein CTRU02_03057 [Colletotrichum truncatum]KAF6798015.1 hypothetical protein CTRU02_03057 [Colletotrichum truncatum]